MGLCSTFTNLIVCCISTVSYSILINGKPSTPFLPTVWLRKEHPLSPYLFLLYAEALSGMFSKAETSDDLHEARVCRAGPSISHLLFADDNLIFGKVTEHEILFVKDILVKYSFASSQRINYDKSELFFSRCISDEVALDIGEKVWYPCAEKIRNLFGSSGLYWTV